MAGKQGLKRVPPLVWIVLAILLAWIIWWFVRGDDTYQTSTGMTVPATDAGHEADMPPPTPGSENAPPGGRQVEGPQVRD